MSFYNADPRAYFQWYEYSSLEAAQSDLNNLEVGRLVRIIDTDSQSSANNNYKIYKVTLNNGIKILEEFNLTNPYSMAIGEGTNANQANQTVVGTNNEDNQNALFIVGNGTDDENQSNAFEVLDGSSNANTGIKINGHHIYIDNENKFYVDGTQLTSATQLNNSYNYIQETPSGTLIGTVKMTDSTHPIENPVSTHEIYLPTTLEQDITITGDVTINGTTDLKDNVFIASTKKLTTDTIESISPTGNNATSLKLNLDGNTQIGKTISKSGTKEQTTSGLKFGNYNISILTKSAFDALGNNKSNTTLYFVIDDPSSNYQS